MFFVRYAPRARATFSGWNQLERKGMERLREVLFPRRVTGKNNKKYGHLNYYPLAHAQAEMRVSMCEVGWGCLASQTHHTPTWTKRNKTPQKLSVQFSFPPSLALASLVGTLFHTKHSIIYHNTTNYSAGHPSITGAILSPTPGESRNPDENNKSRAGSTRRLSRPD